MYGTFKVVPELFFQLYTVHALVDTQIIPCVYGLLPNKQEPTYTEFLQILKDARPDLNPETITVDFELAPKNAVTPPTRRKYQDITRRLQQLVGRYGAIPRLDFLRGIAHNLHL